MEGSHCKLCTGLTDGLSSDYADSLADSNKIVVGHISAVALSANAVLSVAVENGTDSNSLNACVNDLLGIVLVDELVLAYDKVACLGIVKIVHKVTAKKSFLERLDHLVTVLDGVDLNTLISAAVLLVNDNVLRNVNQTTCEVTGVSGTKSRICQTLTGASGGDEVFQNVKTFTIVSSDRHLDGRTRCIGDQTSHTCQLTDLVDRSTGT